MSKRGGATLPRARSARQSRRPCGAGRASGWHLGVDYRREHGLCAPALVLSAPSRIAPSVTTGTRTSAPTRTRRRSPYGERQAADRRFHPERGAERQRVDHNLKLHRRRPSADDARRSRSPYNACPATTRAAIGVTARPLTVHASLARRLSPPLTHDRLRSRHGCQPAWPHRAD